MGRSRSPSARRGSSRRRSRTAPPSTSSSRPTAPSSTGSPKAAPSIPRTARDYARGRLVLVSRSDLDEPIAALADLGRPDIRAVAIADPEFAPYGRAAREALEAAGLWESIASKVVRGRSVRQALQYAESGDADAALVAESLALASGLPSVPIDPSLHEPLDQRLAVTASSSRPEAAADFAAFLIDGSGRAILRRHGFLAPSGATDDR